MAPLTNGIDSSEPHVLRSEEEYDAAVAELDGLLDRDPTPGRGSTSGWSCPASLSARTTKTTIRWVQRLRRKR